MLQWSTSGPILYTTLLVDIHRELGNEFYVYAEDLVKASIPN